MNCVPIIKAKKFFMEKNGSRILEPASRRKKKTSFSFFFCCYETQKQNVEQHMLHKVFSYLPFHLRRRYCNYKFITSGVFPNLANGFKMFKCFIRKTNSAKWVTGFLSSKQTKESFSPQADIFFPALLLMLRIKVNKIRPKKEKSNFLFIMQVV